MQPATTQQPSHPLEPREKNYKNIIIIGELTDDQLREIIAILTKRKRELRQ